MLVNFSFGNFKSFKDENSISFVAGVSDPDNEYTIPTRYKFSVMRSTAIYGANASGKSKLFEAIAFLKSLVCPPHINNKVPSFSFWKNHYDPFRLSIQSVDAPSFFEAVFIQDDILYRYGVELNSTTILDEWLYRKENRETLILSRKMEDNGKLSTKIGKSYINEKIYNNIIEANMVSPEAPLLTTLAIFNDTLCREITDMFSNIAIISANEMRAPVEALMDEESKKEIIKFIRAFDFNIEDFAMHEISLDAVPEKIRGIIGEDALKGPLYDGVSTIHRLYNEYYEKVGTRSFMMEIDESFGTNRLFRLSWPILQALKHGYTLLIDEVDSGLHPFIASAIIRIFYAAGNDAQLIVNTQSSSLLTYPIGYKDNGKDKKYLFRKDQIYVVNKNRYGESTVCPITDFKRNIRSDMEKMYLDGQFTGVPYIDVDNIIAQISHESQQA